MKCTKILQKLNLAKLCGMSSVIISDEDISYKELEEIKYCGFIVKEEKQRDGTLKFKIHE